ncbi:MAG: citrate lyase beta subunit [Frankiales bacterium]|nr:citrate lyase beta subunit [Frankiales bacterium]
MRHFDFLNDEDRGRLFHREPECFTAEASREVLATALGATLYLPATRPRLAADLAKRARLGVLSAVICLEDAIADAELSQAEANAVAQLKAYAATGPTAPLIFIRVRAAEQIPMIVAGLGSAVQVLIGFVLPKFTLRTGPVFLDAVAAASHAAGKRLLAMPVLESPEIVHAENRIPTLLAVRELLASHREHVLAVRLGATDLSSAYGLRRSRDLTVYDVRLIADVISDVVNVMARADGTGHVVTGPVWEYFSGSERMFKPQLRESPFIAHSGRALRTELIAHDLDALIREVALDKANGLTGKTVIHPSHVAAVHALSVVTYEEYCDATDILGASAGGGVIPSAFGNKMNESKPHSAWSQRIMRRAAAFGVASEDVSFVDLLGAGLHP